MSSSALDITAIVRRLGQVMEQDPLAIPLVAEPWVKDGWKDGKAKASIRLMSVDLATGRWST